MHGQELSQYNFGGSLEVLLELVAAFCLGEVVVSSPAADAAELSRA